MSGRIVVGVDGSEGARAALAWAVDEARLRGSSLEAVHTWQPPLQTIQGPYVGPVAQGQGEIDRAREDAERVLAHELQSVGTRGVDVVSITPTGPTASALLDVAKGADLLVVGTRGHGGFAGLLLGSVSQQVSHHAPCPVVVVPRPDTRS